MMIIVETRYSAQGNGDKKKCRMRKKDKRKVRESLCMNQKVRYSGEA